MNMENPFSYHGMVKLFHQESCFVTIFMYEKGVLQTFGFVNEFMTWP